MVIDQVQLATISSSYSGPVYEYAFNGGASSLDFGYRPEFKFTNFTSYVKNDAVGDSQPDQWDLFAGSLSNKGATFNIHFGSFGNAMLSGSNFPTDLDLSQSDIASGRLIYSANGQSTTESDFSINSVSIVSSVPEPESYAMLLAGLCLIGVAVKRRIPSKHRC
jgi:hypothetical protein